MGQYRNAALFVSLAAVWGTTFAGIEVGLGYFPPVLYAAYRYELAGVLLLGYAVLGETRWRPTRADLPGLGIRAVFMFAVFHALLFVGQQYTTSAVAAIVVGMNPILTAGFARLFLPGERLSAVGVFGLVLGLAGVTVLADPDLGTVLTGGVPGELFILGGIGTFALGSVFTQRTTLALSTEATTAWSMFAGGIVIHAISLLLGESPAGIEWTTTGVAALFWIAIVPGAIGFLLYFALLDRIGSVQANLVNYAVPVIAAVIGWALLGESLGVTTGAGFLLIFSGFVLVKRRSLRRAVPQIGFALR